MSDLLDYLDIISAKEAFKKGENVTQHLKNNASNEIADSDIIEIAYDLQAGLYINNVSKNPALFSPYYEEMADVISKHIADASTLLDVGTGEMTALTNILNNIEPSVLPSDIYAFDISWSRIAKGRGYLEQQRAFQSSLTSFVSDIKKIPLPSNSIDVIISCHALEPNGSQQLELMRELFRVAKSQMLLFEPCYEIADEQCKKRMREHGYIRDLPATISELGGTLVDRITINNVINPNNPTACFIVDLPHSESKVCNDGVHFTVPGTDLALEDNDGFLYSEDVGLSFPILKNIPILRDKFGIVSTAISDS